MEFSEVYNDIKSLKTQGARNTAVVSLKFLREYGKKNGFKKDFFSKADKLAKARETPSLLHNCIEIVKKDPSEKTINKLLVQLRDSPKMIGEKGERLIKNRMKIMTHCHSSEFMGLFAEAKRRGRKFEVYVTETRPKNQGYITAKELVKLGIPVKLITDSSAGYYMKDVDMLLIGADAIRKEGIVNKTGTFMMALTAQKFKKPVYSCSTVLKLDSRNKIKIEMRDGREVADIKGVNVLNPAFDITPWNYITRVVTDRGVFTKSNLLRLMK